MKTTKPYTTEVQQQRYGDAMLRRNVPFRRRSRINFYLRAIL